MQIHVARPPTQLGVFSPEEVAEGLRAGRFLPTDHGWREGMSAWSPLNQWTEFAGVVSGTPASSAASVQTASQVPWEQGKSAGSFFATIKAALFSPRETFAHARLEVSDWLLFAYVANLIALPVRLLQMFVYEDVNAQIARLLERFDSPSMAPLVEGMRRSAADAGQPAAQLFKGMAVLANVFFGPLILVVTGLFVWVGLWAFRQKVEINRAIAATLMASSVGALCLAPLGLLGFNFGLQLGLMCLLAIPCTVLYMRAHGAAIQRSAWVSFGAHAVWYLLLACCLGAGFGLIAIAAKS